MQGRTRPEVVGQGWPALGLPNSVGQEGPVEAAGQAEVHAVRSYVHIPAVQDDGTTHPGHRVLVNLQRRVAKVQRMMLAQRSALHIQVVVLQHVPHVRQQILHIQHVHVQMCSVQQMYSTHVW